MTTLETRIGRMLAVGFEGLEAPAYLLEWLRAGRVGTIILFARNIASPEQVARLTQALHAAASEPLMICIDQEGGAVARLRAQNGFTESPGAMALGTIDDEHTAEAVSAVLAREMRAVGINWNLAPAIDITHDTRNPTMGTRSIGVDPARVSALAAAQVRGYQRERVMATAKHFPGLGNTPVDTHEALAVISGSADYLWKQDLIPFRAVIDAGIGAIMINHVQFEALDAVYPSTMSPAIVTGLLRGKLGFDGLIVTDCMEMRAISTHYPPAESAVLAALAGIDVILYSHTPQTQSAAYEGLLQAAQSGRLPLERIEAANARLAAVRDAYAITPQAALTEDLRANVGTPENINTMRRAARDACVLLKHDSSIFPITPSLTYAAVEFVSAVESGAVERGNSTQFVTRLQEVFPNVRAVTLTPSQYSPEKIAEAAASASNADVLILVTRSAHMFTRQSAAAAEIIRHARRTILVCARGPFDADMFPAAGTILLTCGDAAPSLDAAVDALTGAFTPTGQLPVPLQSEF